MPAPIRPSQVCATVPTSSADFCSKIKLVLVQLPNYLCQLISYIFNEDGTVSSEFKDDSGHFYAGDYKWSASSVVQMGWLYANGQAVSRTTYAALFSAIGTTYGIGDGSTTFNVPDLRGYFMMGVSAAYPAGTTGGAATVILTQPQMPAHHHAVTGRALAPSGTDKSTTEVIIENDWQGNSSSKNTDARGEDQAHENLPPYKTGYIYIKY